MPLPSPKGDAFNVGDGKLEPSLRRGQGEAK
nr:hypothetical protein [Mucilaginibacter sp. SP1R1]